MKTVSERQKAHTHINTLILPHALDFTTSPPHSSQSSLIPGRGSSPWCLCLNSRDSGIIQTFHGAYLVPPGDSGGDGKCHHGPRLSLPPLSLLFNQALSVAHAATVVRCLSLGKCRPKWLLCAEAKTTGTQRGAAGALCASRGSRSG